MCVDYLQRSHHRPEDVSERSLLAGEHGQGGELLEDGNTDGFILAPPAPTVLTRCCSPGRPFLLGLTNCSGKEAASICSPDHLLQILASWLQSDCAQVIFSANSSNERLFPGISASPQEQGAQGT